MIPFFERDIMYKQLNLFSKFELQKFIKDNEVAGFQTEITSSDLLYSVTKGGTVFRKLKKKSKYLEVVPYLSEFNTGLTPDRIEDFILPTFAKEIGTAILKSIGVKSLDSTSGNTIHGSEVGEEFFNINEEHDLFLSKMKSISSSPKFMSGNIASPLLQAAEPQESPYWKVRLIDDNDRLFSYYDPSILNGLKVYIVDLNGEDWDLWPLNLPPKPPFSDLINYEIYFE